VASYSFCILKAAGAILVESTGGPDSTVGFQFSVQLCDAAKTTAKAEWRAAKKFL